jgi:Arc/MetJ family transcription regulator
VTVAKVSLSLDADLLAQARERVGRRELSAFVNEALRRKLDYDRLGEFLAHMEAEHGPIPEDMIEEARKLWQPAPSARPRSKSRTA